jgi:serine/threonine protein kinase
MIRLLQDGTGLFEAIRARMELQSGGLIGPFVLDRRIGDGAFSQMWQAHHTLPSAVVAIKVIEKASISTPIGPTRLTREISLLC